MSFILLPISTHLPALCFTIKVMSAEANFMRVRVTESTADGGDHPRDELLCVVRKLLKKMNRNVLVGDRVRVDRVDWVDGRGE